MTATLSWDFPLPRPHTGLPLGNGTLGVLFWGGGEALHLTLGRAGFWDHRGGNAFSSATSFPEVRALLESGNFAQLREIFGVDKHDQDHRPYQIGCGRLALRFPGYQLMRAELSTDTGSVCIYLDDGTGHMQILTAHLSPRHEVLCLEVPPELEVEVTQHPAWDFCKESLSRRGVSPPDTWCEVSQGGWQQDLPEDNSLAASWQLRKNHLYVATALGDAAKSRSQQACAEADAAVIMADCCAFWQDLAARLPRVELPDPALQHSWDLGVFRFNAAMTPRGVPCTLQGPWLEETQLPPWSCDYHFNINAEMIHLPGLPLGRSEALTPLWDLLRAWLPRMREVGAQFFGDVDAVMLPHAVDDRCQAVGGFWTGVIDHACTGWMALLAYDCWRYGNDAALLDELVRPLLQGAFVGYWAMHEEKAGLFQLPVTVSPEFRGHEDNAWGRDASFQLACWHAVTAALIELSETMGDAPDPRWAQVRSQLPPYTLVHQPRQKESPQHSGDRIGLWEDLDLIESHRHHSHLAGLWPFRTLDPQDERHANVLENSMYHFVRSGPGAWSGWSVPWAAVLNARMGWGDGAVAWLHWWRDVFTNEGHGTLHDGFMHGHTTLVGKGEGEGNHSEIFQLDAGMGALTAISELLVQERGRTLHVLPCLPRKWRKLRFDGLYCPQGLRIGATVSNGQIVEVRVESTRPCTLALHPGMTKWTLNDREGEGLVHQSLAAGEKLILRLVY